MGEELATGVSQGRVGKVAWVESSEEKEVISKEYAWILETEDRGEEHGVCEEPRGVEKGG